MNIPFEECPSIIAGMSERSHGSMVWWNRLPVDEVIRGNRDRHFRGLGIDPKHVIAGGILHEPNVAVVGDVEAGQYLVNTDALITNSPNLFLTVTVADCVPVYFFDSEKQAIGIAHAGWKGLVAGILERTVEKMAEAYGSRPETLSVFIGPHIGVCHYDVGEEVAARFNPANIVRRDRAFVNLTGEVKMRLRSAGVAKMSASDVCTYCQANRLYSARFDKKQPLEGAVAYIGLRP